MQAELGELIDTMVKTSHYTQEKIAEKLEISVRTLRRYQYAEHIMPTDKFWQLVLITRYYDIIPRLQSDLDSHRHKEP